MPGQETASGFDIHSYPVVERHECIWVWTGDPTRADHTLVPESRLTENGLAFRTGVLEYSSDYQLINGQSLRFQSCCLRSQEHSGSGADGAWAQQLPILRSLDNGIRVTRWIEGAMMPPTPGIEPGLRIDQYTAYDYVVPGVLTMQIEAHPLGTAKQLAFQSPPTSMKGAIYVMRTLQMATSDQRRQSSLPVWRLSSGRSGAGAIRLTVFMKLFEYAFAEDKEMIEAQQRSIDERPPVVLRATKHDTGLMRVRRLIAKAIRDEQQATDAVRVRNSAQEEGV